MKPLTATVKQDEYTKKISKSFDFQFDGVTEFLPHKKPNVKEFKLGLIVGSSGSGKSTLLKEFGKLENINWNPSLCVASHFESPDDAISKLTAVGLNSIPSMLKPFHVLSNGEQYRAYLAKVLKNNACIDEFSSVVDRNVAMSMSVSVSKYINKMNLKNIVLCSCHRDIIDWLDLDWVFNADNGVLDTRGWLRQRFTSKLNIYKLDKSEKNYYWNIFKKYHYLDNNMHKASQCFVGVLNDDVVAFSANLPQPGKIPPLYKGDIRKKYRGSRTVVLADYQGMGIGTKLSNAMGEYYLESGYRYFCKTAHIRMGEYRQKSKLWRATTTNLANREKSRGTKNKDWHHWKLDTKRICYSHEYIGNFDNTYRKLYDGILSIDDMVVINKTIDTDDIFG